MTANDTEESHREAAYSLVFQFLDFGSSVFPVTKQGARQAVLASDNVSVVSF